MSRAKRSAAPTSTASDIMYEGYYSIARVYDRFNSEIDYKKWGDFVEECFDRTLPARPQIILDLACGTGRMTFEMAGRGYDLIGIDGSADMLSEAYEKSADIYFPDGEAIPMEGDATPPLFLQQDMRAFELYGTVDAALCCLDSINYLVGDSDLDACLNCLNLYIAPGGLLIFDVNTPYKFENVYGDNSYIFEDEIDGRAIYCGWQNQYDAQSRLCSFSLSLFEEREDGAFVREDEEQTERCYTQDELKAALVRAGFDVFGIYGGLDFSAPAGDCLRWYIVARTKKRGEWYLCEDK